MVRRSIHYWTSIEKHVPDITTITKTDITESTVIETDTETKISTVTISTSDNTLNGFSFYIAVVVLIPFTRFFRKRT